MNRKLPKSGPSDHVKFSSGFELIPLYHFLIHKSHFERLLEKRLINCSKYKKTLGRKHLEFTDIQKSASFLLEFTNWKEALT